MISAAELPPGGAGPGGVKHPSAGQEIELGSCDNERKILFEQASRQLELSHWWHPQAGLFQFSTATPVVVIAEALELRERLAEVVPVDEQGVWLLPSEVSTMMEAERMHRRISEGCNDERALLLPSGPELKPELRARCERRPTGLVPF